MRRAAVGVAATLLGLALYTNPLHAQAGTIRGKVSDSTGTALPRVTVTVDNSALRAQTDERGEYLLVSVPAGSRTVTARLINEPTH